MEVFIPVLKIFAKIQRYSRFIYAAVCVFVVIAQASYMNYVYANVLGLLWCFWAVADALVILVLICDFVISNRIWRSSRSKSDVPTTYPLSCLAWFIYSLVISLKIGIFYGPSINAINLYYDLVGGNYLKFTIALCSIVFLLLVLFHQDKSSKNVYEVEGFGKTVSVDLLDTVQFLDLLVFEESQVAMTYNMHILITIIACMNIVLPIIMLISFSNTQFGRFTFSITLEVVHLVYHSLLNIPMVVVRSIVTAHFSVVTSVFLVKNLINVFSSIKTFISHALIIYKDKVIHSNNSIEMENVKD